MPKKRTIPPDDRVSQASDVATALNHKYGKTVIRRGSDLVIERIPSGLASFDLAQRQVDRQGQVVGYGLPRGKFSMVFGGAGGGKSTLCFQIIRQVQQSAGLVLFIDGEHKFDPVWARASGVDTETLDVGTPTTMEEMLDMTIETAKSRSYDLIVVDSIVSMASTLELRDAKGVEFDIDHSTMAVPARRLSEYFRKATAIVGQSRTAVLFVNQVREKLGGYIVLQDFPGGHALRHYLSATIRVSRSKTDRQPSRGLTPAHTVTFTVTKGINEGIKKETTFFHEIGYDPADDLVTQLITGGFLAKKGPGHYDCEGTSCNRDELLDLVAPHFDTWYDRVMKTVASPASGAP